MEILLPITLILVGLGLVVAEVYLIPGFNVVGIAGALAILLGVGYAFVAHGLSGGVFASLGALVATGALFWGLWQSGAWDRFILATDLGRPVGADDGELEQRRRLLGRVGTAVTPLRPGGVAEVDGLRVEVQTEGGYISAGSAVRIVAMDRRRFFVRLADAPHLEPAP